MSKAPDYRPGHAMHHIQARLIGETPWGWREGVVRAHADGVFTIDYLEGGAIEVWHGQQPGVPAGTPVRVHERFRALEVGGTWVNVDIRGGGLGPVPEPAMPELWRAEQTIGITSVADGTGFGVPPA